MISRRLAVGTGAKTRHEGYVLNWSSLRWIFREFMLAFRRYIPPSCSYLRVHARLYALLTEARRKRERYGPAGSSDYQKHRWYMVIGCNCADPLTTESSPSTVRPFIRHGVRSTKQFHVASTLRNESSFSIISTFTRLLYRA